MGFDNSYIALRSNVMPDVQCIQHPQAHNQIAKGLVGYFCLSLLSKSDSHLKIALDHFGMTQNEGLDNKPTYAFLIPPAQQSDICNELIHHQAF